MSNSSHARIASGSLLAWMVSNYRCSTFNYNTQKKVTAFEAHPDYIPSQFLMVHPTASIVWTGSDDMLIKAWKNVQVSAWVSVSKNLFLFNFMTYKGHTHYIMNLAFNPKDANTFLSTCLDCTVKMWSLSSFSPSMSFIPTYPSLLVAVKNGTVKIWNSGTYCIKNMLSYALEHA